MDFQRARSKEQKDARLEEIIKVTCKQYDNLTYDKISMASIAKELSFTRGNLYTYASSKEEIFLMVILASQKEWAEDVIKTFEGKSNLPLEDFAKTWAQVYYSHKRLLSLYSLLYSIIEKNVSLEKLTQFKVEFFESSITVYETMLNLLPFLSQDSLYWFYTTQFHFLRGFYPATLENETQAQAIKKSGIPYRTPDFIEEFSEFIIMLLKSIA